MEEYYNLLGKYEIMQKSKYNYPIKPRIHHKDTFHWRIGRIPRYMEKTRIYKKKSIKM